jgi:hypothetical protein
MIPTVLKHKRDVQDLVYKRVSVKVSIYRIKKYHTRLTLIMDSIDLEDDVAERDVEPLKRQKVDAKKTGNRGKSRLYIKRLNHT